MRKTKIVCTLGPACESPEIMRQMLLSGMNVARMNFSHGSHEEHGGRIKTFRAVRRELGLPAALMLDTKGPELRTGLFQEQKLLLKAGDRFTLYAKERMGDETGCSVSYPPLIRQLTPGANALIDDGRIRLEVEESDGEKAVCRVLVGGRISDHKGINVPNIHIDMPYLSEADKRDLIFGVENIDSIIQASDGIMVARGDMGVEVEYERLPGIQKRFIRACYAAGKVAITATQMLDSMMHSPRPTRAEITDVANAVFDGTSAIMLSGETASGEYPVEAVQAMARIAAQAEADAFLMDVYKSLAYDTTHTDTTNAICDAACTTARDIHASAIIAVTKYGGTARGMSKFRPAMPIVAATPEEKTYHQLAMSWGVYPVLALNQRSTEDLFRHAVDCARQLDLVRTGDLVVITAGVPLSVSGTTNLLKVQVVGDEK